MVQMDLMELTALMVQTANQRMNYIAMLIQNIQAQKKNG